MCTDDFGDAPCEEVPNDNATVIAAYSQQGAPTVEGAGEGHADTVQSPICLLTTHKKVREFRWPQRQSGHTGSHMTML